MNKPGRNSPCPCGSGKKYKQCCLLRQETPPANQGSNAAQVSEAIQTAIAHHQAGRLAEAEVIYKQVLASDPENADALHLLGVLNHQAGNNEAAVHLINQALRVNPDQAFFWSNRGEAYRAMGQYAKAESDYRQALKIAPDDPNTHSNLGIVLQHYKQYEAAENCYRRALSLNPGHVDAQINLGNLFQDQNKRDEAIACYRQAISIKPDCALAHNNLGVVLMDQGLLDAALASYRQALSFKPDYAEAYSNLGNALKDQGKLNDAIASYHQAISLQPNLAMAYSNLGNALQDQGRLDEAAACCRQALSLKPDYAEAHNNLGNALRDSGKLDEALSSYRQALSLKPAYAEAHNNLGNALLDSGLLDAALASYRQALSLKPDYAEAYSNLLFARLFDPSLTPAELLAESMRFAEQFEAPLKPLRRSHPNTREPERRLKLGYVSPDFRRHAVACFIEPVLACHDKSRFEIFCYYNHALHDDVSERIASCADHWVPCKGWPDERLAERIRSDGIDILVDLAGHTAHNRMLTFARKPAPVQVSYLGYLNTTGLSVMDYRLTDAVASPAAWAEKLHVEKLAYLPHCQWCFAPPQPCPEPGPLPARRNAWVTFASFHNLAKVTEPVMLAWAEILRALPESRLIMVAHGMAHERIASKFSAMGIDPARIRYLGGLSYMDYLSLHREVDVCLDTFPYSGGTTTCESLWMGVPVVTYAAPTAPGRGGASLMNTVGLGELVAESPDSFVRMAVELAADVNRLEKLRSGLRERVRRSPLCDGPRFTADLENVYRRMWREWCMK